MADKNKIKILKRTKKKMHIRKKVHGTADRPRLVVFRSAKNIYTQLVDDVSNRTLTALSTLSPDLKKDLNKAKNKIEAAKIVGNGIAQKANELKIETNDIKEK